MIELLLTFVIDKLSSTSDKFVIHNSMGTLPLRASATETDVTVAAALARGD